MELMLLHPRWTSASHEAPCPGSSAQHVGKCNSQTLRLRCAVLRRRLQPAKQTGFASGDRAAAGGLLHGHHVAVTPLARASIHVTARIMAFTFSPRRRACHALSRTTGNLFVFCAMHCGLAHPVVASLMPML